MAGGARPGAGRKTGAATRKTREIAERAIEDGITPLEFMLNVMRDDSNELAVRFQAAKDAAPYIHPRLSAIDANIQGKVGLTVEIVRFSDLPDGAL